MAASANQLGGLEFLSKTFIQDQPGECEILFEGGERLFVKYN